MPVKKSENPWPEENCHGSMERKYIISRLLVYLKLFYDFIVLSSYLTEKPDGRGFRN
jgi:hypothetical protein